MERERERTLGSVILDYGISLFLPLTKLREVESGGTWFSALGVDTTCHVTKSTLGKKLKLLAPIHLNPWSMEESVIQRIRDTEDPVSVCVT